jgi:hypothetical protein
MKALFQSFIHRPAHRIAVSQLVSTEPGFPVDVCGPTELHAAFREESRTSLFSPGAALQEIREGMGLVVVFSQGKPHLALSARTQ